MVATSGSLMGSTTRARSTSPLASWRTSWREPASTTKQLDPRMAGVEFDQGRSQHTGDQAGRGADGQPSAGHTGERPRFGPRGLHVGQDAANEGQQRLTVRSECDQPLARPAVKQKDPQLAFEQAHLAAQ